MKAATKSIDATRVHTSNRNCAGRASGVERDTLSSPRFVTRFYGRTSKDDPRTVTIETQQKHLREWGLHDAAVERVAGEYWDEGVSGKIPLWERPAGKRLLADVKADLAAGKPLSVAVVYADRFGRTLLDGLQAVKLLEDMGVKLVAIHDGWDARRNDSKLYFQFRMMLAEEDHRRICERLDKGKRRAMDRDNAPPGGPLTFGYRMDSHGQYVVDPAEGRIVIRIYEMMLQGRSQNEILRWVQTTGVPAGLKYQKRTAAAPHTCSNHLAANWHPTKIGKILRNRTYTGVRCWADREFPCPPLVDVETFDAVQGMLSDKPVCPRGDGSRGLLAGLLTCKTCGASFYHRKQFYHPNNDKTKVRREQHFYACNNARAKWGVCKAKLINVAKLDADVWQLIETYLADPESLVRKIVAADKDLGGEVADIAARERYHATELEQLDADVSQIWAEQKTNKWPTSWVTPKLNELNAKRELVLHSLDELRRQRTAVALTRDQSAAVTGALASIRSRLSAGLSTKEKLDIVRMFVAGGVVETKGTGQKKTAHITLQFRWGEQLAAHCRKVPEDW